MESVPQSDTPKQVPQEQPPQPPWSLTRSFTHNVVAHSMCFLADVADCLAGKLSAFGRFADKFHEDTSKYLGVRVRVRRVKDLAAGRY